MATKKKAIEFRRATIDMARGRRWVPEFETRSEFEAGRRAAIDLASREIDALSALADDASAADVYRALLTVSPGDATWTERLAALETASVAS